MVQGVKGRSAPRRVVVVGGGAAGVITAAHLLRTAGQAHPVEVTIIERGGVIGPGLAYRTKEPLHTLNNFAGRLSAVEGDPDHLLRWCIEQGISATPTSFLPRALYGRYLVAVFESTPVPDGSALHRLHGTVVNVRRHGGQSLVQLSCGATIESDVVVLALGNPPPRRHSSFEVLGDRYLADPWADDVVQRVRSSCEVLLLGTGLTMVDVVAQLQKTAPGTRFTAVSRRGLLPTAHRPGSRRPHDIFDPGCGDLDTVLRRVQERVADLGEVGGDWRDVVDSVRASANSLWAGFSSEDQDRFIVQFARHWEIRRHRIPPEMAAHIASLQQSGDLQIARVEDVDPWRFDRVINCTGPAPVPTRGWNRLVDCLLEQRAIRPHRLGLGLDLSPEGAVIDSAGRTNPAMFAVGAARRGIEWEVAAVPDLRTQAARLAVRLLSDPASTSDRARPARGTVTSA